MSNSTFIKLSNYALLEYKYSTDTYTISQHNFSKVTNIERKTDIFFNRSTAASFSKNVIDYSFIEIEGDRMGHLDIDRPFSLHEVDDNINYTENLSIPTGLSVKYDTLKIHLLAGFNLTGLDGIGLRVSGEENETNRKGYLLSHFYAPTENTVTQNPTVLTIGEQVFDRYIEIKIPSLSDLNTKWLLTTFENPQLAEFLTANGKGFKSESLIRFEFFQFFDFEEINNKATYKYNLLTTTAIPQIDQNSLINAHISESTTGDYFEFFAKYDNEFIADYLAELNSRGQIYIIVNEIRVYENYGNLTRVKVSEFPFVQTGDFDKVNKFRPVISENAYSFIIEYSMRLVNQLENTQILRVASISCGNDLAKKYGPLLGKIEVSESSAPIKIYNRIGDSPYKTTKSEKTETIVKNIINEIVRYTQNYKISINSENIIPNIEKTILSKTLNEENIIYGNGKGVIYLSSFDNYIKFKIFNTSSKDSIEPLNISDLLSSGIGGEETLSIVFFGPNDTKKYIYYERDSINENEIIFKIPSKDSLKIKNYTNKEFGILYINSSSEEQLLYSGKFTFNPEEYNSLTILNQEDTLAKAVSNMNQIYMETQSKLETLLRRANSPVVNNITNVTNIIEEKKSEGDITVKQNDQVRKEKSEDNITVFEESRKKITSNLLTELSASDRIYTTEEMVASLKNATDALKNPSTIVPKNIGTKTNHNINKLNLSEIPGIESNFALDSNVKNVLPSFLKNEF